MWQSVLVGLIVAAALFLVFRRFRRSLKAQDSAACGCCTQDCGGPRPETPTPLSRPPQAPSSGEEETGPA